MDRPAALLIIIVAVAQAFDMTPWCTTLVECEATVMNQYSKCMDMAKVLMPDTVGATDCENRFWNIINTVMDTRYNDTMMLVDCLKTSDPVKCPALTNEMTTTCTTIMPTWPKWTNTTFPKVVEQLFKRVSNEMNTFMTFFPANTEFTQCITDAFCATKRCYPLFDCCNVAATCRETLSIPPATVTLNRIYNMMHSFNTDCKTITDFNKDTAPTTA
jgi:hypothetical protein